MHSKQRRLIIGKKGKMLASFRVTLFFLHPSVAGNTPPSRRLFLVCLQNACKAISVNEMNGYMAHKKKTKKKLLAIVLFQLIDVRVQFKQTLALTLKSLDRVS